MTGILGGGSTIWPRRPGALVLSPHLDDGVLSCALAISALRSLDAHVDVVTLFAGQPAQPLSPAAARFHAACGQGAQAISDRRLEDRQALAVLGAMPTHLDFLDALYRRQPDGSWRCKDDDGPFHLDPDDEPDLRGAIAQQLVGLLRQWRPALLLLPLAVGDHVDHRLTRQAGRVAVASLPAQERPQVLLYEDIPYAHHDSSERYTVASNLRPVLMHAVEDWWSRKITAIGCYPSQVQMLWPGQPNWPGRLEGYAERLGAGRPAERLWQDSRPQADWPSAAISTQLEEE